MTITPQDYQKSTHSCFVALAPFGALCDDRNGATVPTVVVTDKSASIGTAAADSPRSCVFAPATLLLPTVIPQPLRQIPDASTIEYGPNWQYVMGRLRGLINPASFPAPSSGAAARSNDTEEASDETGGIAEASARMWAALALGIITCPANYTLWRRRRDFIFSPAAFAQGTVDVEALLAEVTAANAAAADAPAAGASAAPVTDAVSRVEVLSSSSSESFETASSASAEDDEEGVSPNDAPSTPRPTAHQHQQHKRKKTPFVALESALRAVLNSVPPTEDPRPALHKEMEYLCENQQWAEAAKLLMVAWAPPSRALVPAPNAPEGSSKVYSYCPARAACWELNSFGAIAILNAKGFQSWNHRREVLERLSRITIRAKGGSVRAKRGGKATASGGDGQGSGGAVNANAYASSRHTTLAELTCGVAGCPCVLEFAAVNNAATDTASGGSGGAEASEGGTQEASKPHPLDERDITRSALFVDPKNYHAWAHRLWFLRYFGFLDSVAGRAVELDFSETLLRFDIYNNSAWAHRCVVLTHEMDMIVADVVAAHASTAAATTTTMGALAALASKLDAIVLLEVERTADFFLQYEARNESAVNYVLGLVYAWETAYLRAYHQLSAVPGQTEDIQAAAPAASGAAALPCRVDLLPLGATASSISAPLKVAQRINQLCDAVWAILSGPVATRCETTTDAEALRKMYAPDTPYVTAWMRCMPLLMFRDMARYRLSLLVLARADPVLVAARADVVTASSDASISQDVERLIAAMRAARDSAIDAVVRLQDADGAVRLKFWQYEMTRLAALDPDRSSAGAP